MTKSITVKNLAINIKTSKENDDFICLTDMAKFKGEETGIIIANWLTTKFTIQFLGIWEEMYNPNFNLMEFHKIKNEVGSNGFIISSSKWINATNAIGIRSSAGRYGGTFAHKDIAFEFASWLSPEFKLYLIKEFQRLKEQEKQTIYSLEWQIKRSLAKTNYKIHTNSIAKKLKGKDLAKWQENLIYASEADMINLILWGKTAKEWEMENPNEFKKGFNMRDMADITDLIVLSNLETLNARFIDEGRSRKERSQTLLEIAEDQKNTIAKNFSSGNLKELGL
ncbi:MAG: KilA-N domain-containing protein [Pseudomonadota bacterium]